jgi:hypothetical protein
MLKILNNAQIKLIRIGKNKKAIIKTINSHQLVDIVKYYHSDAPPIIWTSYPDPNIKKRLDYIYLSPIIA